ncbi:hypothetical protein [Massilia sp. LjRoot122]|uniref:hypothetical protein n=1 Tax=Massilia sp. LjRoot122 TaxID=3342257 RepID=UPI003ECE9B44
MAEQETRCLQRVFLLSEAFVASAALSRIVGHLAHISADLVFILHLVTVLTGFGL